MEDINIISQNDFGMTFSWKRCAIEHYNKVNFVFGKYVLHLYESEILIFIELIEMSLDKLIQNRHETKPGELMFVETPTPQLSLIMNYEHLVLLQNLVEATLLELGVEIVLKKRKTV